MSATIIQAPQAMPARHGLLDAVFTHPEQNSGSDRWENGFGFVPENCDNPESWVIPCQGGAPPPPGQAITDLDTPTVADHMLWFWPFLVRSKFRCDAQQLGTIDFEARAKRIIELGEQKLIESELYAGAAHGYGANQTDPLIEKNLSLTDLTLSGGVDLSGGAPPTTPSLAIRMLIQAAARGPHGARCMIHGTPAVVEAWMQGGSVIVDKDQKLVTAVGGHVVVAGAGYSGNGPNNVPPLPTDFTHWAWVTSPVYVLRSPQLEVTTQIDRRSNTATAFVQRTAAVFWDGCVHAGVPVNALGTVV